MHQPTKKIVPVELGFTWTLVTELSFGPRNKEACRAATSSHVARLNRLTYLARTHMKTPTNRVRMELCAAFPVI